MTNLTRKDKLIPWYFVIFFAVIMTVDGVMATLAIRTNSGLVTDHAYEKGLAYNQVVSAKNAQDALGWKTDIAWDGKRVNVVLHDKKKDVIQPEKMQVRFTRPAQPGMDFEVDLLQQDGRVEFPAKGAWDARFYITYQGHEYQQPKRLVVE